MLTEKLSNEVLSILYKFFFKYDVAARHMCYAMQHMYMLSAQKPKKLALSFLYRNAVNLLGDPRFVEPACTQQAVGAGNMNWDEEKITRMQERGCGRGVGAEYKPWLEVTSISSNGRSRRVWSPKVGRVHHLLSDTEYGLFLLLEWARDVIDIREQYPLDRDVTQEIARRGHLRHPFYPGTQVPTVMTVDFMVTRVHRGTRVDEAFNAKLSGEAENQRSMVKLEIQRRTLRALEIPHNLVFDDDLPNTKVANINWIRDSLVKGGEAEPQPGYWMSMAQRMSADLRQRLPGALSLASYCTEFETKFGAEAGAGLRAARLLMHQRVLRTDLNQPELQSLPLSSFTVAPGPGELRVVGSK